MKLEEWLEFFRKHLELKIFHFDHLRTLTDLEGHSLRVALKRLNERRIIRRICRGFYANPFNAPTLEEVSAEVRKPSYISLESALYRHGILSQMPQVLTCVTLQLPREFRTSFGSIQYRRIQKAYFFGFARENDHFCAEPEKALVDFLYLNKREDTEGMIQDMSFEELDWKKLKAYAKKLKVSLPGPLLTIPR